MVEKLVHIVKRLVSGSGTVLKFLAELRRIQLLDKELDKELDV
jgi:hypothetical protein